jgi:hypothetical protein
MAKRNGNLAVKLQPVICAESLIAIKAAREKLAALAKQAKDIEDSIEPMENEIIAALEAGAKREPGSPVALVVIEQDRVPKWKEEFVKANSQGAADAVIARTIPSVIKRLVIN